MERAKMGVRISLLCVVIAAVLLGLFYYYNDVQKHSFRDEGTLVMVIGDDWSFLWG